MNIHLSKHCQNLLSRLCLFLGTSLGKF